MAPKLTQTEGDVELEWVAGDPVNLQFTVMDTDWSGTWKSQVRKVADPTTPLHCELTVTAVFVSPDTEFTLTRPVPTDEYEEPGEYRWDMQLLDGITKLRGPVHILKQVTVFS